LDQKVYGGGIGTSCMPNRGHNAIGEERAT
jgi:hypothetical protein